MAAKNHKTNVLFALERLGTGGSERVVLDLARHLDPSRFTVFTVYFSDGELRSHFKDACRDLFWIPKKSGLDFRAIGRIAGIIRRCRVDVVNAHHYAQYAYSYAGAKILNRCRLVFTEHAVSEITSMPRKHRGLCRLLFHQTDAIVGISEQITDCFRKTFPRHSGKMTTILNGLDIDRFQNLPAGTAVKTDWRIDPADFVIGMVANFRKIKNHACLVQAVHLLQDEFPNLRLVLVGQGFQHDPDNTEHAVRQQVHASGMDQRVLFTGYRDDIHCLLKMFDLFCLTSFAEGLPVSLLEAMAAGVPAIGSDVPGINEVITHETNGLLFPSDNSGSLAQAIRRLIRDPALGMRLRDQALERIRQKHSLGPWIEQYEKLFLGRV